MSSGTTVLLVILASAAAAATVAWGAEAWWRRETRRVLAHLRARMAEAAPETAVSWGSTRLPAPVKRYFSIALAPDRPGIRSARFEQAGEFALRPGEWKPFTAVEELTVWPPGFVWDARIRMAPFLTVRVRDSYVDGAGTMHGAIAALVPVAHAAGTAELASAALLRWLAEAPWLPTALLPAAGVDWEAVDDHSARATVRDGEVRASMLVRFGSDGLIERVTAERFRADVGRHLPWEGRHADYRRVDGMMVPTRSEVGWVVDGEYQAYWRGSAVSCDYAFVPTLATAAR